MEKMKEVNEFKYLGLILCEHESIEGKMKERTMLGRKVVGSVDGMMRHGL